MKADEVMELETTGWTNPNGGEAPVIGARVRLGPAPTGKDGSLLSVVIGEVETHALIGPFAPVARKLRRLATFHRGQGRFPAEMDVQDELRAMEVLAKTLDSLDEETSRRVLSWLTAREQAADLRRLARQDPPMRTGFASVDEETESLRIAKDYVLGGRE